MDRSSIKRYENKRIIYLYIYSVVVGWTMTMDICEKPIYIWYAPYALCLQRTSFSPHIQNKTKPITTNQPPTNQPTNQPTNNNNKPITNHQPPTTNKLIRDHFQTRSFVLRGRRRLNCDVQQWQSAKCSLLFAVSYLFVRFSYWKRQRMPKIRTLKSEIHKRYKYKGWD